MSQDGVPHIAGQLDHLVHAHRAVYHAHPVPRRGVLQRQVLFVLFCVRHVDVVQFQGDLRHVAVVNVEPVLRGFPHPGEHFALRKFDLRAVTVLHLLADLQLRVQHFRPDVRHRQHAVDVFLRQRHPGPVLPLGDRVDPRDDPAHVPGPLHGFHVDTVPDLVGWIVFLVLDDVDVQVIPDHPGRDGLQQSVLWVQDGALRVLPAPVRLHCAVINAAVQASAVRFLHRAGDEHQRCCRRYAHHIALAQDGPSQLVADVLRLDADVVLVRFLVDEVYREQLRVDVERRDLQFPALPGGRAFADLDVPLVPCQRGDFHVGAVEIPHLHDGSAAGQRGDRLPRYHPGAGDLRPQSAIRRRYAQTAVTCVAYPVLVVVCHLVPGHVGPERLPVVVRLLRSARQLAVQGRAGVCLVVAHRAQVNGVHMLRRYGYLQDHSVIERDSVAGLPRDAHGEVIPPAVLPVHLVLRRMQLNAVIGEARCPFRVQLDHSPSLPYRYRQCGVIVSFVMLPVNRIVLSPTGIFGNSPCHAPNCGTPFRQIH